MIKRSLLKKIGIAVSALIVVMLIYLFPKKDEMNTEINTTNESTCKDVVYLLDKYNYVSRVSITDTLNSEDVISSAKNIIKYLTINNNEKYILPSGFSGIIPSNTELLSVDFKNGILKINFSKELLTIDESLEEKMVETLVFSLTELKNVEGIMIFVEADLLAALPHSGKILPQVLTRKYGANKSYEIDSLKDVMKVTVYYLSEFNDMEYYVPVTKVINGGNKEKIEIIVEELQSSSIRQTNLKSYLASSTKLMEYEILEDSISLSFSNNILNGTNNKIMEEVTYTLSLSVKDTYDIDNVTFKVDNEFIETKNAKSLE